MLDDKDAMAPEAQDTDPAFDRILANEQQRAQTALQSTLATSVEAKPDAYAQQRRDAAYVGLPPQVADILAEVNKRNAAVERVKNDTTDTPVLKQQYTDTDFAKLAHDDSGSLAGLEKSLQKAAEYVFSANPNGAGFAKDVAAFPFLLSQGVGGVARAGLETAAAAIDPLVGTILPANPLAQAADLFATASRNAGLTAKAISPSMEGIFAGGVQSGVQSAAQTLGVAGPLLMMGAPQLAVPILALVAGGNSFQKDREEGQTLATSLIHGATDAVAEWVGEKYFGLKGFLDKAIAGSSSTKLAMYELTRELPGEIGTTLWQNFNDWSLTQPDKSLADFLAEQPAAVAQTAIATLVGGGLQVSAAGAINKVLENHEQIARADAGTQLLGEVFKRGAQAQLQARAPDRLESLVQSMADTHAPDLSAVRFDGRTLAGEDGAGGVLNQEQLAQLPEDTRNAIAEAISSGGEVSIPLGHLVSTFAGTPLEQELLQNARVGDNEMSQVEAQEAAGAVGQLLEQTASKAFEESKDAVASRAAHDNVKASVLADLNAVKRFSPEVNETYSSLVAAFYSTMAARKGITAEELYAARKLGVRAEGTGVGEFDQPAYHGTPHVVEKFTTQKIGTGEGAQAYGWGMYFAEDKGIADFYRRTTGFKNLKNQLLDRVDQDASAEEVMDAAGDMDMKAANVLAALQDNDWLGFDYPAQAISQAFKNLDNFDVTPALKEAVEAYGQTYKVEVPANEQLLDWHAKVGDQPQAVKDALSKLGINDTVWAIEGVKKTFDSKDAAARYMRANNTAGKLASVTNPMTGRQAYEALGIGKGETDEAASRALLGAGVPGLRYRDAGSRGVDGAKATHNFVIFDDSHVQIEAVFNQQSKSIEQATPDVNKLLKYLTPAEQAKVTKSAARKILAHLEKLPSAKEMAAVAYAGRAKRGWYAQSAQTISDVFGFDAPRFAALLAAQSPQCSVEVNLSNTLNTWKNWIAAGRPTDREEIIDIMGRSVQGDGTRSSVLDAWVNNSVTALTHPDIQQTVISGPKVNSFMLNLLGNVVEVTNDAWMANYALVDQAIFGGVGINKAGTDPGKGSGYLAMNARVREAAAKLTKLTGEEWTPAEVQETIWSWAKTLYELANSAGEKRSAVDIVRQRGLSNELINSTPDFGTLFHEPEYASILKDAGYERELNSIADRRNAEQPDQVASVGREASPFADDAQVKLELAAARRLDQLAAQRAAAKAAGVSDVGRNAPEADRQQTPAGEFQQRGGVPGGDGLLDEPRRQDLGDDQPLEGLPATVEVDGKQVTFGPLPAAREAARRYMERAGLPYSPPTTYAKVDEARATRIARQYSWMIHDPKAPDVKASYEAMIAETLAQYEAILETGLKVEFNNGADPYGNPRNAILDVVNNNHLYVFSTKDGFGSDTAFDPVDNPLLAETKYDFNGKPALVNDIFRVVHDYFGHIKEGVGFRAGGEENAWRSHASMYSPLARRAMTTETRGQNSWVNFGPNAKANATANGADTIYADQKIGLLPEWVSTEGATDERPDAAGRGRLGAVVSAAGDAPSYGEAGRENAISVTGYHYSTAARNTLNSSAYGTGLKGSGRERYLNAEDPRSRRRVYFYADKGQGIHPEAGVGGVPHIVNLQNVYDSDADPLKLKSGVDWQKFESAVMDAGFDGFLYREHNLSAAVVLLGDHAVPVAQQELAQPARGTFNPKSLIITLKEGADLSTFLHESGHFFLTMMSEMAATEPAIAEDMNAILKWFGIKGDKEAGTTALDVWNGMSLDEQREHHEKFAESFEQYLFSGKAPSVELQPAFSKFRAWMVNVYKSLKDFLTGQQRAKLNPTVVAVFDRMLATDEQIKTMEQARAYEPLFKNAAEAGMTEQEYQAHLAQGQEATDKAIANLEARSLKDMGLTSRAHSRELRKIQTGMAKLRKEVEDEIKGELAATKVEQARAIIKETRRATPESTEALTAWKTKRDEEQARQEEAVKAALIEANPEAKGIQKGQLLAKNKREMANEVERRVLAWEKENRRPQLVLPDADMELIAAQVGYDSADAMLTDMLEQPPMRELVEGMADQRMLERYGELTTQEGMRAAADEAVHNEARSRFLVTELKALQEGTTQRAETGKTIKGKPPRAQTVNVLMSAAKQFADMVVARTKVRELRPGKHTAAETRSGKAAMKALAAGDTALAIASKRDQVLQNMMARGSTQALDDVQRGVEYLRKLGKSTSLAQDYQDQIDKLLERVELKNRTNTELNRRASLADWLEKQAELGVEPEIPGYLMDEQQLLNYRDMTVEQFRGLVDTAKAIEHIGRLKNKLLLAKDAKDLEAARQELADSIIANAGDRKALNRTPASRTGRWWKSIKDFSVAHIKSSTWARILDGGKDGGPMWERFIRPANERANFETARRAQAAEDLTNILAPWLNAGNLGGSGKFFATINRSLNREQVLAMALNTGNDGNFQRLLDGEGWTLAQVEPILATLSREDWQAVQKVWDYLDSFRPEIGAKQKRVTGQEPEWVVPAPRTVNLADGTTIDLKGGYYPIKYDPLASGKAGEFEDADAAKRLLQGAHNAATTRRTFTKNRAEEVTGRPLLLTLSGLYTGVNDVIHDLAWHEWLIDTNRLLRSDTVVDKAIREHYGQGVLNQFKTWRVAIAEGDSKAHEAMDGMLGRLRRGVSAAGLGFNVMSAMMQPLGMTQSIVRVGPRWVGQGIQQYIANPVAATKDVHERSEYMRSRARTQFRDLNEIRNRVDGQTKAGAAVTNGTYFLMMQVQQMVDIPTWYGAYNKAVSEGNEDGRAIALADQAVKDAQGGGETLDLSAIERGGPAQKLFTTFYSFMNTALNLGVSKAMTEKNRGKLAADLLMIYTVPAILGTLLKDALTPGDAGDDDWQALARKLIGEQLSFLMGLMVGVREFGDAGRTLIGAAEHPRDYSGPAGTRAIADTAKLSQQINQGEFDDSFRKAAINVIGAFTGLPAAQANRTITGFNALKDGETQNPLALLFGYQEP